jgi:hypothetical protein
MSIVVHTDLGFWMDMSLAEVLGWKQDIDRIIKESQHE